MRDPIGEPNMSLYRLAKWRIAALARVSVAFLLLPLSSDVARGRDPDPGDGTPYEEPEFVPSFDDRSVVADEPIPLASPESAPEWNSVDARARAAGLRRFLARARDLERLRLQERTWRGARVPITPLDAGPSPGRRGTRSTTLGGSNWSRYMGPFGIPEAAHLLHRTTVGPRFDDIEAAAATGLRRQVSVLLRTRGLPPAPAAWVTEPVPDMTGWTQDRIDSLYSEYWNRRDPLRLWWADVVLDEPVALREQMVLFWHDHFATSIEKVAFPQSMYTQNQLLRRHALGNFKLLVKQIAVDPAMLIWLDGYDNRAGHLNENWGRELLELFTLGVGNYGQDDVVAAARAFTGWTTPDGLKGFYVPAWHDNGQKTFLGRTGNWNGNDIIEIVFQQPETARFLCRKLYRWFIDEYPDEALIEDLAQTLRQSNYEVTPVLRRMFESNRFMDARYRGALITDGVDRSLGSLRALHVTNVDLSEPGTEQAKWVLFGMGTFGQVLFEPPNVGGWPGYHTWLNSNTLPWRKTLDAAVIDGQIWGYDLGMKADVLALALSLTNPHDPEQIVSDLALLLFGMPPTEAIRERMLDELLQGAMPWEWSIYDPLAEARLRDLLKLAVRLPDYQLK